MFRETPEKNLELVHKEGKTVNETINPKNY